MTQTTPIRQEASQGSLAREIYRRTGLDLDTASEIARHAAMTGQATFMTATVLLFDGDMAPVSNRRGLARWLATGGPDWELVLRARET